MRDSFTNLAALINALSDATFQNVGGIDVLTPSAYGASGGYDGAEDRAVFAFATAQGTIGKIGIPAPKSGIFLSDDQTVDPSNADVAAFVAAMLSGTPVAGVTGIYGATKSGTTFTTFLGALRVRGKTRRKLNIWVRNPELTAPGI